MRAVAFVLAAAAPYRASALLDHGARRALRSRRLRGATFGLVTRTSPSDANAMYYPQQAYGKSVAIDGDIAVVGAPGDSNEKGAAYVLRTTDGGATYVELAKLTASDRYSVAGEHRFGWSVAIDGDTIVVGAPGTVVWDSVDTPGAAYVYRTTDGWASHTELKLTADDAEEQDGFGGAVAIAGSTIVVGAWNQGGGAAYVYRTTDGGGTYPQVAKLSSDCVNVLYPSQPCSGDAFGASVAISASGDTVVAGAWGHDDAKFDDAGAFSSRVDMGSAYVLRTTDAWSTHTTTKLTAADAAKGDEFGISVAIDGDTVVVGAWKDDDTGSAYVFRASDGTQLAKVTAADGAAGDEFGGSVAVSGDTIVIGAEDKDETAYGTHGAAYVYRTSDGGATYSQMDKLAGSDDNGSFGASVALDGSTVLVGESNGEDPDGVVFDGSRARSGVVHVFSSDASLWSSGALGSTGSSSNGSSGGSDSNTGAIVAGCVFGAFALLFVGAVVYFYRLSPEEQAAAKEKFWAAEAEGEKKFWAAEAEGEKQVAAAKEKFWAAEAEGEKQVKALFAKAEAEGEPETAAEEAAP